MKPEHRGQEFSDFLDELGIRGEVEAQAIKEILADQIRSAMDKEGLSKTAMAARMRTSRRALDRLLASLERLLHRQGHRADPQGEHRR